MSGVRIILISLAALMLAACGGSLAPMPGPGADPASNAGSLPSELVGNWFTGTISSIQFYNPVSGSWAPPNGEGFYFIFRADGTYEEGAVINSTQYNCTIQLLGRAVGTAEASGGTLTLHQDNRKVHVTNTCNGVGDNEVGAANTLYTYELKNDENNNYGLFLTQSDGTPYAAFYPWEGGSSSQPTVGQSRK